MVFDNALVLGRENPSSFPATENVQMAGATVPGISEAVSRPHCLALSLPLYYSPDL